MAGISGKNIVITGGAAGIGRLMAILCAKKGANLALLDIHPNNLDQTVSEIQAQSSGTVKSYLCDITSGNQVEETTAQIRSDFQRVDILINNAGIVAGGYFSGLNSDAFQRTMEVNYLGLVRMTQQFLPEMVGRNDGQIVNIASTAGYFGMPQMSEYCASKFAVVGLSDSLRMELKLQKKAGVKITVVCPYVISTGMFDGFKPLRLNPILDPEKAARKIIRATEKKKPYLFIPGYLKSLLLFKLFPAALQDWMMLTLGAGKAMEDFRGSRSTIDR